MNDTTRDDGGRSQAIAQFRSIVEMVNAYRKADKAGDEAALEDARIAIEQDALSVQVRSGWYTPGVHGADTAPAEFEILLCTGGPAVRIIGTLSEHAEPEKARIEYQDWFTPWREWIPRSPGNVESFLLEYARVFYYGE